MNAAGIAIAIIVLIMVIASVTLLPAFWVSPGPGSTASDRGANPARDGATVARDGSAGAQHVSQHARAYTIGVTVLLLALTAPVLALRMGNPDEGALPDTRTERRAYDLAAAAFGPGSNGPLVIAVDTSKDPDVVEPLRRAVGATMASTPSRPLT